jgi:hypothetical protein
MALTKVQSDGINLADNFAFTGTVSGSGMNLLLNATISSPVSEYDISSTYINGTYDEYILSYNLAPSADGVELDSRVFVGGTIQTGSIYAYEVSLAGSSTYDSSNGTTLIRQTAALVGSGTGECISGFLHLRNVNNTTFPFNCTGANNLNNTSGNHQGCDVFGTLIVANRANVVNGFRLFFSSADGSGNTIASGTVKLYGLRT